MLALVKSLTVVDEDEGDDETYSTAVKENERNNKITPISVPKIPLPPPIPSKLPQPSLAAPMKPAFVFVTEEDEMREKEELKKKNEGGLLGQVGY